MTSLKDPRIRTAIPALTPRQREVLVLVARGYSNPQIGEALGISLDGAKWHVSEIMTRLGVDSREEAAAWWRNYNRPTARLARAAHAFWPAAAWAKAGAAVVGVGAASAIAAVTIVVLNSGGPAANLASTSSPMPSASVTVTPAVATPTPSSTAPVVASATASANATAPAIATNSSSVAPSLTSGFTQTPAYTGLAAIDGPIQAMQSSDYAALSTFFVPHQEVCGEAPPPADSWPSPCAPSVPAGTPQEVYLVGGCDGPTWMPTATAATAIPAMLHGTPRLYGLRENPDATYSAVFRDDDESAFTLTLTAAGITAVGRACGAPAEAVLAAGGSVVAGPFS